MIVSHPDDAIALGNYLYVQFEGHDSTSDHHVVFHLGLMLENGLVFHQIE
jgi:hypothetical protein